MIEYPVDVVAERFSVLIDGVPVRRGVRWPRADGTPLADVAPGTVLLREVYDPEPAYDPLAEKLGPWQWLDSPETETATRFRQVVALTPGEAAAAQDAADREAKLAAAGQAVVALRAWADDAAGVTVTAGNAVAVLQTMVARLAVFFDRFADLLEGQHIDQ
jgi:hypothetical protein